MFMFTTHSAATPRRLAYSRIWLTAFMRGRPLWDAAVDVAGRTPHVNQGTAKEGAKCIGIMQRQQATNKRMTNKRKTDKRLCGYSSTTDEHSLSQDVRRGRTNDDGDPT